MQLDGKTAVITGAAGDIGSTAARRFSAEGANLVMVDRDEKGLLAEGQSLIESPLLLLPVDVSDENDVRQAAAATAKAFGTIDILFINAGIEQSHTPLVDMDKTSFERIVSVNLTGAFLTAKHFVPLIKDKGSIIVTSSLAALVSYPAYSAYSASKAGLIGLMRSLSTDVGVRGVRCNTIHPGPVESRMLERSAQMAMAGGDTTMFYEALSSKAKLGKLVTADDVVSLALFLASDESRMITGQSIAVDGEVVE